MNYTELSLKRLKEVSIQAALLIAEEQNIDLVIYVARAGLPIAVFMNEVFKVSLLGIKAQRKGNKIKHFFGPILAYMPRFIRDILISIELKSNVHKQNSHRNVEFHDSIAEINAENYKNILLVDDSVDTGYSMKICAEKIKNHFPNSNIYSYSLNVWEKSRDLFDTDYYSYMDTVIRTPMSKDSKEYRKFCEMYDDITKNGYI